MSRAALALVVVAWLGALAVEAWLGARLAASDTVAGLISPQGVSVGGLLAVAAFVGARLLAVLVLPSLVAAVLTWWAGSAGAAGSGRAR